MIGCRWPVLLTLGAGAALLIPVPAEGQAYQCSAPRAPVSVPRVQPDGPRRQMEVAGYTLALSWSPEYCRFRQDSAKDARQCSGRAGRFGFIVHGLWPEGPRGSWPQWCPARRALSPAEVARNLCMTPSAALLAREWAKHGSCAFPGPETYYKVTRILWNSLRWPDYDRISRQEGLTAGDVRKAFADANPHWEPDMIGLELNSRGWLEEMRLCYASDFKPAACDASRYGPADETPAKIWRGL